MKTNSEIRQQASQVLKGNWGQCVLATFLEILIAAVAGFAALFVSNPLSVGVASAYRSLLKGDGKVVDNMFSKGFDDQYWKKFAAMLLVGIFCFLWALLFIIPGIIKTFAYFATPYVIEDRPDLGANSCIDRSKEMMRGYKGKLFWMDLGFFFLILLASVFTLGIGLLWLIPWINASHAAFYEDVKADREPVAEPEFAPAE